MLQDGGNKRSKACERNAGKRQMLTKADIPYDMQCSPSRYVHMFVYVFCVCVCVCGLYCCRQEKQETF